MDKNIKLSSPRNYFLKAGLGSAKKGSDNTFHSKLKSGLISPNDTSKLKSIGYRRDSKNFIGKVNNTTNNAQGEENQRAASPKFSNYFAIKNNNKKASTTTNKTSKKIIFFKPKEDEAKDSIKNSEKISGKSSPKTKENLIERINKKHSSPNKERKKSKDKSKLNNTSVYNKTFYSKANESTKQTEEKSKVQIKWDGNRWPDIQSQLLFGQCIGEGSFAKVYDAFDKVLKKAVAVKVIKKKMFKSEKKRKLVQMEIDILSGLDHPNIVKFYRMLEDHKRVRKIKITIYFF